MEKPPPDVPDGDVDAKLLSLLDRFPQDGLSANDIRVVPAAEVPEPYRKLLVHHHHMTVTLEAYHGDKLRLAVLNRKRQGDDYARKLVLKAGPEDKVVLSGVMRFHLEQCQEDVRREILAESTPLGRILIEHRVLRWIKPHAYLRVRLNDELRETFKAAPQTDVTYGRVALIICHNCPAVELLEIVAPAPAADGSRQ